MTTLLLLMMFAGGCRDSGPGQITCDKADFIYADSSGREVLPAPRKPVRESRQYHPVTVAQLASGRVIHTHVELTGTVRLVKREDDGDLHIRVSDGRVFIVAECIPQMPCAAPKKGQRVRVRGITRYDKKHGWAECHPVESLEILP